MNLRDAAVTLAALADDLRRRIYLYIRGEGRALSRQEIATEFGISTKLAAFHLEKLHETGLLKTHYGTPPSKPRRGPGRTSKLYEPSDAEIDVSIPPRRYDLLGAVLAAALPSIAAGEPACEAVQRLARQKGQQIGDQERRRRRLRPPGAERALAVSKVILADYGFEPYGDRSGALSLGNCPFWALSQQTPDVVCPVGQSLVDGLLRALGNHTVLVEREPSSDECCLRLRAQQKRS